MRINCRERGRLTQKGEKTDSCSRKEEEEEKKGLLKVLDLLCKIVIGSIVGKKKKTKRERSWYKRKK